jgi:hypothetical protein
VASRGGSRDWGQKPRITGIASHLNHVPDTTCHIKGAGAGSGTAIAYITTRQGRNGQPGEGKKARDSKKAWVRVSRMAQPDTVSLNKNDKTLLHTQASDRTPRQKRGGFFWVLQFPREWHLRRSQHQRVRQTDARIWCDLPPSCPVEAAGLAPAQLPRRYLEPAENGLANQWTRSTRRLARSSWTLGGGRPDS